MGLLTIVLVNGALMDLKAMIALVLFLVGGGLTYMIFPPWSDFDFSQSDWQGVDVSEGNLSGWMLNEADFRGANLSKVDCSKAKFVGADFTGANLQGTNLMLADLSSAKLNRSDLRGANLSGAKLKKADLQYAVFDKYTIWPDDFDPVKAGSVDITPKTDPKE